MLVYRSVNLARFPAPRPDTIRAITQYGLITNDNISKSTSVKSDSSNKKTIEDYLNNSDDNKSMKSNSYVSTILLAQSSDPYQIQL